MLFCQLFIVFRVPKPDILIKTPLYEPWYLVLVYESRLAGQRLQFQPLPVLIGVVSSRLLEAGPAHIPGLFIATRTSG